MTDFHQRRQKYTDYHKTDQLAWDEEDRLKEAEDDARREALAEERRLSGRETCPACHGTGAGEFDRLCGLCEGLGWIPIGYPGGHVDERNVWIPD